MIDPVTSQRWLYRSLFVGICMVIVFFQILPLSTLPTSVPGPDLLLCLTFAWVHRRPEFVPPLLIALVFLTVDMLTQRPPGLRVALILLAVEFLLSRHDDSSQMPFAAELLFTVSAIVVLTLGYGIVLRLLAVADAPLHLSMIQMVATILFYPLVAGASHLLLSRLGGTGDLD
ncbi:MAG: rod shape-determining protein MreD [Rhodovulum sp.]|jgi:rod shape-determining protein MreD|nr:rod shape-determining protein MreD [Rhodovulum sp.]